MEKLQPACVHGDDVRPVEPTSGECLACLAMGDSWVSLRLCLSCGHVGCCDSSRNRHATKHFHHTRHPLIRALDGGEKWWWCYVDETKLAPRF